MAHPPPGSDRVKRIQKISFKVILGTNYVTYQQACNYFSTQTLEQRHIKLCLKFSLHFLKSDNWMFTKVVPRVNTRQNTNLVTEYNLSAEQDDTVRVVFLFDTVDD